MDYLTFEKNYIRKKWRNRIAIALVFPNFYRIGMSNLGYLYIYKELNKYDEIVCERVFLPEKNELLRSIENKRPLKDFDIILFSIPFEVDYINVIKILKQAEIPLEPRKRKEIVLAGGVALWLNFEPLFPFIDAFLLGEWEEMEEKLIPLFLEYFSEKEKLLTKLNELEFVYCPEIEEKTCVKVIKSRNPEKVVYSKLISEKAEFSNSYLIEISKGCGRGCRFCAAGFVYRPPRSYPEDLLYQAVADIPDNSKIGLIGLEFANKEEVLSIGKKLLEKNCVLTFSSLRIDALNEDFLELLTGTRSVAVAPETGSPRLKKVINKNLAEEDIFWALEQFQKKGLKNVKIYFMLGLPTETRKDLEDTVNFIKKILKMKYRLNFSFTFSFFVPKPHTPFQWHSFPDLKEMEEKKNFIRKQLYYIRDLKIDTPKEALLQTLIIRGNRRLKDFLISQADGENLKKAMKKIPDIQSILKPEPSPQTSFPWDKIDTGLKKSYLWEEWKKAIEGKLTPFCKVGICKRCGVC